MKKVISLGKINYGGKMRNNEVTVELKLEKNEGGKICFSACAYIWNSRHTDIKSGGQILDKLLPYFAGNDLFMTIFSWWRNYHLNDMHAGTPRQERALKEMDENFGDKKSRYEKQCDYLKSIDLYEDNGYKYGTGWLYEEIPDDVLKEMRKVIE